MRRTSQPIAKVGLPRLGRWVVHYGLGRWPAFLGVLAAIILKIGFDVLKPWPMKVLVDNVLRHRPLRGSVGQWVSTLPGAGDPEQLLVLCVAAIVAVFLVGRSLGILSGLANVEFGRRLSFDLAADLFAHMQRLSLRFHHHKSVGDSIRRIMTDCGCISSIVKDAALPVLTSILMLSTMFGILWQLNRVLTLAALVVAPFMFLILRRYADPMMRLSYAQQQADGAVYTEVERTLSAIPVIQAFTLEGDRDRRFRENAAASLAATMDVTRVQLQFKFLIGLGTAVGTAAIIWIGAHEALAGRLSLGTILVFLSYLSSLYGPLESLAYSSSAVQGATGSARRVLEVLDAEPDVRERAGAVSLIEPRGEVRFENVAFGYESGRPVLRKINLHAPAGATVALVGPSGAGKSTMVSLIPRFFDPWLGRVCIDGRDVRDIRLRDLRENVAVVLQDPFLFPISLAANIAYGKPGATQDEIERAARAANVHEFISRLPQGYETVVGERGVTLSGGERQRISIARALVKNAPILILDEPTSAVDAHTESLLVEALQRLMKGRTTFIIAHRLSTVRQADRIFVLQAGRIVETGTHDELRRNRGLYAQFCTMQFAGEDHGKET